MSNYQELIGMLQYAKATLASRQGSIVVLGRREIEMLDKALDQANEVAQRHECCCEGLCDQLTIEPLKGN